MDRPAPAGDLSRPDPALAPAPSWRHSLRLRLGIAYVVAVLATTLTVAIYRDLAGASHSEGGVLRLFEEMRHQAVIRRIPWMGAEAEMDRWVRAFAVAAESDSMGRRLVEVAVVDADGRVLGSAGPGRLSNGRRLGEALGPKAGALLSEVFAFPIQCSDPPPPSSRGYRLKDGSGRLANGHDLAIVAVQDDQNAYIYGAVVRELEPTLIGNLRPLASGVVRAAPAPIACGLVLIALTFQVVVRRLERLSEGAREWSRGNLARRIDPGPPDELARLTEDLNGMARRLDELLQTREDRAASSERDRLARDLHDAVKQQLFAAKLHLAVASGHAASAPSATRSLVDAQELVESALRELSGLLVKLQPPSSLDLGAALDLEAQLWSRASGLPIEIRIEAGLQAPPAAAQALVRVLQEALANVARHSGADAVEVRLTRENGDLVLGVHDDGRGFDPQARVRRSGETAEVRAGFGLSNMRDRMREVGGWLDVTSAPGEGTRLAARLPLPEGPREGPAPGSESRAG
jgi:signal transduction histidine kinase